MNIYLCSNTITGKEYVGRTCRSLKARWREHNRTFAAPALAAAIRKHGREAFKVTLLETVRGWEHSAQREAHWIASLKTMVPHGYNLSEGGAGPFGHKWSEQSREKVRQLHRNPIYREKRAAALRRAYADEDLRKRIAALATEALKGDEIRKRISDGVRAAQQRAGHKEKRSAAVHRTWADDTIRAKRAASHLKTCAARQAATASAFIAICGLTGRVAAPALKAALRFPSALKTLAESRKIPSFAVPYSN
ncbi:MAG: GIY-YIG nuclease family protein [Pseudomonadota bacterium]